MSESVNSGDFITIIAPPNKTDGGLRACGNLKRSLPNKPLLTVITVVFNGAATLEHTIRSVIEQTYDNVEYIIIDGCSTDTTPDILRKYENQIDYWVSEKDAGIYDAMNKGIALATGDYIGMLNSDDFFVDPMALEMIVRRLNESNLDAVFSCLDVVDKNNPGKILRKYRVSKLSSALLRIGVMPPHPTFYCKRSCYEQGGMYKTDYKIAADFEMLVRLLMKQKISWEFIDKVTVIMRSGGVSSRGLKARITLNREVVRACRENGLYTNWALLALKLPIRMFELIR